MKILRTVILAIAILISIFFIVYSNIQSNLAQEHEYRMQELLEESQRLQQEAERVAAWIKEELEECRANQN